jgi:predicted TIM-barrel fold metal-dependent hydrolase
MADPLIDIFCHIFPERYFQEMTKAAPNLENMGKRLKQVTKLFDLDARFREMDEFGDYRQIISLPNPPIEDIADAALGLTLAHIANDAMAELCRKHPERFPAFVAAVSLKDVEGSVAEARRAVKDLGACGIQVYTPNAGRPLDDPMFEPIFAAMAELDLPIWLHPARGANLTDYPAEAKSRYELWWCFGWPYDTSVAMVRMVFCGLFDRHPNLKIITHHLGGMIPYYDGRVGPGLQVLGARTSDEDYSKVLPSLKRPHLDYLRDFYGDTAMFGGGTHALLRTGILRRQPRRVRHRYAAWPNRPHHRGGQTARLASRSDATIVRRKRRAAAQQNLQLDAHKRDAQG